MTELMFAPEVAQPAWSSKRAVSAARRGYLLRRMLLAADVLGLFIALVVVALVGHPVAYLGTVGFASSLAGLALTLPLFIVAAKLYGLYDRDDDRVDQWILDDLVSVFHLLTVSVWLAVAVSVVTGLATFDSRWVVFWAAAIATVLSMRYAANLACRRAVQQPTLILGTDRVAAVIAQKLLRHAEYGMRLVGFVRVDDEEVPVRDLRLASPIVGDVTSLRRLVEEHEVERVIVSCGHDDDGFIEEAVRQLRDLEVRVDIAPRLVAVVGPYARMHTVEGLPLVSLPRLRLSRSSRLLKRATDVVIASLLLLAFAPVFAAAAALIKLTTKGPVFFRQERVGERERIFQIYKFRTMVVDAEMRKSEIAHLNKHLAPGQDPRMFKVAQDPRVTRVGAFLRRYSLDELPQLINVLSGEMSMVGPRPLILDEHQHVVRWAKRRLDLKPGLTGLWQVLGRSGIPFDEMVKLDYLYVTGWSIRGDLKLMVETLPAMLRARDAY